MDKQRRRNIWSRLIMKKYKEFINELINPKLVFKSKDEELAAVQKQLDDIEERISKLKKSEER